MTRSSDHPIIELAAEPQWTAACRLLEGMYPDRTPEDIRAIVAEQRKEGWRALGVFEDARHPEGAKRPKDLPPLPEILRSGGALPQDDVPSCRAFLFLHIGHRLYSGKFLRMDSMTVHPDCRGEGLGKRLMNRAEEIGRAEGCNLIMLDSYVDNFDAHRFFFREGGHIRGYHIVKPLRENAIHGIPRPGK